MREDYDAKDEKKDRGPRKSGARRGGFRKKVCRFCANSTAPDYKNPDQLKKIHYRKRQNSSCSYHR